MLPGRSMFKLQPTYRGLTMSIKTLVFQKTITYLKSTLQKSVKYVPNLKIKTPEQCHRICSGVFIVNFENISHLFLLLLNLNRQVFAGMQTLMTLNLGTQSKALVLQVTCYFVFRIQKVNIFHAL